jgi:hypothetical protein
MRIVARSIALISLFALGAVACSQDPAPAPTSNLEPEAILRQASNDLTEQTIRATLSLSAEGGGESVEMTGDMTMDPVNELAHMRFSYDGMPGMPEGGDMELVLDGTTMYMRGAMLPEAGWIKVDADESGMDDPFDASGQMDPSTFLAFLRGAEGIEVVGTETVNGAETTHFAGTIDFAEFIAHAAPGDEREQAEEALAGLEAQMGEVRMGFDAWVDAEGVPWRVSFSMTPDDAGMDASIAVTVDLLEIGGDVEIEVPSDEDVIDLGSIGLPTAA